MVERFRKVTVESARYGDELVMARHLLRGPASKPRALRCPGTGGKEKPGGVVSETFGHITIYLLNRMTVSGSKMIRHSLRSWLTCNMSKTRIRFSGLITTDDESFEL